MNNHDDRLPEELPAKSADDQARRQPEDSAPAELSEGGLGYPARHQPGDNEMAGSGAQELMMQASGVRAGRQAHHYIPVAVNTVHWGYFSKTLKPVLSIEPGDYVTIETLTQHAGDDYARMIQGDPGAESVYLWNKDKKNIERRGAGPMDAPIGAGAGWGPHICTGPVFVKGAEPGDVLEVRILDMDLRPSANPEYKGKAYGSNLAAAWGFHYKDFIDPENPREIVTIYELDATGAQSYARPVYNYKWEPLTDPSGVHHELYDYPGMIVDHANVKENHGIMKNVRVPVRPHFGTIGVAPKEADIVNSVPPNYNGGNIDNWRAGKGSKIYFPISVEGALFSVGDPHAAQGDSECCGTAIECSMTGMFQFLLHKKKDLPGSTLESVNWPLLETQDEWVVHGFSYPNYLEEFGDQPEDQLKVFENSSIDNAMRDAYRKMRDFLMTSKGLDEDEVISLMSVAVDFAITQVADGNWGVHASISKRVFID